MGDDFFDHINIKRIVLPSVERCDRQSNYLSRKSERELRQNSQPCPSWSLHGGSWLRIKMILMIATSSHTTSASGFHWVHLPHFLSLVSLGSSIFPRSIAMIIEIEMITCTVGLRAFSKRFWSQTKLPVLCHEVRGPIQNTLQFLNSVCFQIGLGLNLWSW